MKCACASAFPGVISAWKYVWTRVPAYANSGTVAECGANARPCKALGKGEKASPGTTLEGGYASGDAVDRFARVKEPSAGPAAAAEGVAHVGASAVAHAHRVGDARPSAFSMKNQLVKYLVSTPPAPTIRPFHAVYIILTGTIQVSKNVTCRTSPLAA